MSLWVRTDERKVIPSTGVARRRDSAGEPPPRRDLTRIETRADAWRDDRRGHPRLALRRFSITPDRIVESGHQRAVFSGKFVRFANTIFRALSPQNRLAKFDECSNRLPRAAFFPSLPIHRDSDVNFPDLLHIVVSNYPWRGAATLTVGDIVPIGFNRNARRPPIHRLMAASGDTFDPLGAPPGKKHRTGDRGCAAGQTASRITAGDFTICS